jgi:outer membrane phospholipase A
VNENVSETRRSRPDLLEDSFFGHEPVYFIIGTDPTHAKFQLSFKYRFLKLEDSTEIRWKRIENFYFGYTQTSFWDLDAESAPFVDSSYKPEIFYFCSDIKQKWIPQMKRFGFQTGFQHESNGRDGLESRSLNIFYIKPMGTFGNLEEYHFIVEPKIWVHLAHPSENPDIGEYRGFFDLGLAYGKTEGLKLSTNLRKGTGSGKGSIQIDFTYPMEKIFSGSLNLYFQVQFYSGYAETLLYYDEDYTFLRAGFAVHR